MATQEKYITVEQWKNLVSLLPKHTQSPKGRRKPIGNREVFEGIIW
ncbi:MAG: transposase [Planctomycetes bacterium]|nr:transposase [Planctomycetota bacterium]